MPLVNVFDISVEEKVIPKLVPTISIPKEFEEEKDSFFVHERWKEPQFISVKYETIYYGLMKVRWYGDIRHYYFKREDHRLVLELFQEINRLTSAKERLEAALFALQTKFDNKISERIKKSINKIVLFFKIRRLKTTFERPDPTTKPPIKRAKS